jgi:YVTN family beta-propeller protein
VAKLPSGRDTETFVISPDGKRLYASNEDDSMVTVVDIEKRKAIKEIKVGV